MFHATNGDRAAICLYFILAPMRNARTFETPPVGDTYIFSSTGFSTDTIRRARKCLIEAGLIERTSGGKGHGKRSVYLFTYPLKSAGLSDRHDEKLTP